MCKMKKRSITRTNGSLRMRTALTGHKMGDICGVVRVSLLALIHTRKADVKGF